MSELSSPQPKRVGPPEVVPVHLEGLRFEAVHWGRERGLNQNGGVIAAVDASSGEELWTLVVYPIVYDPELEADVQDLFIASLEVARDSQHLLVTDERGRQFEVDIATRQARPLP